MRPRIFIFCFYLRKKLSGDVLAPSDPSIDPLGPAQAPRGPKVIDIRQKSMRPRFFLFCFYLPKKLSGDVLVHSEPSIDPLGAPYKHKAGWE